jgi:hypothetical protein
LGVSDRNDSTDTILVSIYGDDQLLKEMSLGIGHLVPITVSVEGRQVLRLVVTPATSKALALFDMAQLAA